MIIALEIAENEQINLSLPGGWYLLRGLDCADRTRYKNSELREDRGAGFL